MDKYINEKSMKEWVAELNNCKYEVIFSKNYGHYTYSFGKNLNEFYKKLDFGRK